MMYRGIPKAGLLALTLLVGGGCQSQAPVAFPEADRNAIRQTAESWETAVNAKDFAGMAALYVEDGMVLPPNQELVQGRPAIQAFIEGFPTISNFQLEPVEIDGRGDLAYVRGTWALEMMLPGADAPTPDHGKYLEVWRKQGDGSWKIARDIFNSDVPLAPPGTTADTTTAH